MIKCYDNVPCSTHRIESGERLEIFHTLKLRQIVQSKEESKILPDATHSLVKLSDGLINFNFNLSEI